MYIHTYVYRYVGVCVCIYVCEYAHVFAEQSGLMEVGHKKGRDYQGESKFHSWAATTEIANQTTSM